MIRTVFGFSKSGTALIPLKNVSSYNMVFSTRVGNIVIDKGDGSSLINASIPHKNRDFTLIDYDGGDVITLNYSPAFTGNVSVKFLKGLKDVYSFASSLFGGNSRLNIADIETFFKQFPSLYSVYICEQDNTTVLKGDLSRFPDSVERIAVVRAAVINAATDLVLNFSNYNNSSKLKSFAFVQNSESKHSQNWTVGITGKNINGIDNAGFV